jgi:uncharacterized protein (TIGR02300 family)
MATKQARGMKRTCQSSECGARFYDLNRNPIVCPVCGSVYELASSPLILAAVAAEEKAARKARKAEFVPEKVVDTPDAAAEAEVEEALPDIEDGGEEIAAEEDETFLPVEEEEGGDVTNIIGGPVAEGEEER